jgi:hypothetical protein
LPVRLDLCGGEPNALKFHVEFVGNGSPLLGFYSIRRGPISFHFVQVIIDQSPIHNIGPVNPCCLAGWWFSWCNCSSRFGNLSPASSEIGHNLEI